MNDGLSVPKERDEKTLSTLGGRETVFSDPPFLFSAEHRAGF
jgi:hypothetical protein